MSNVSERPDLRIINSRCPRCGYPRAKRDDGNQRTECAACGHRVTDVQRALDAFAQGGFTPTACVYGRIYGYIGAEEGIPLVWLGDRGEEVIVPLGELRVELGVDTGDVQAVFRAVEELCERVKRRASERG